MYFGKPAIELLAANKHFPIAIIEELNRLGVPAKNAKVFIDDSGEFLPYARIKITVGLLGMKDSPAKVLELNATFPEFESYNPKTWLEPIFQELKTQYEAHIQQTLGSMDSNNKSRTAAHATI